MFDWASAHHGSGLRRLSWLDRDPSPGRWQLRNAADRREWRDSHLGPRRTWLAFAWRLLARSKTKLRVPDCRRRLARGSPTESLAIAERRGGRRFHGLPRSQ